jgi:ribosomal protein S18 acetylase RimI-like enzyme
MIIRDAVPDDLADISALWKEFMDFHKNLDPYFSRKESGHIQWASFMEKNMADDQWKITAAEDNFEIVGFCTAAIIKNPPVLELPEFGYIQDMAVKESARGKGIGKLLLTEVENWFASKQIKRIELNVLITNQSAQNFWRRRQYKEFTIRLVKNI